MPAAAETPLTLPKTYSADLAYRIGAVLFSMIGVLALGTAWARHDPKMLLAVAFPFVLFFGALLLTLTFQLRIDADGLHQRSILGRRDSTWEQVQRLDQGKAYAIYGGSDRELVWLSLISTLGQEAVAREAIRRCRLTPSGAKLEYPLRQQWIRS